LLGRPPQPVKRSSEAFLSLTPRAVEAGVPSELLDNRPDVRRAELELEASKLDVKAARAAFFPSVTLDAGVGFEAFDVKHLFSTPASLFYDLAGGLVAPLLNRKAIKAQYFAANAQQLQAVFEFERTLLLAFTEV